MPKGGAARLGDEVESEYDTHGGPCCPHQVRGRIVSGAATVLVDGAPAARLGDVGVAAPCCGANAVKVATAAASVLVEGARAAREGDATIHCGGAGGRIASGSASVVVGQAEGRQ